MQWSCKFLLVSDVVYVGDLWVWCTVVSWFVHFGRGLQFWLLQLMLRHAIALKFGVEWVIVHYIFRLVGGVCWYWSQKTMSTHSASWFLFTKVGSITVHMYYHVTHFLSNNVIRMCRCIIEELSDGLGCELCWFGLLLCDSVECCENGEIYIPSIVQQCSKNLLDVFF